MFKTLHDYTMNPCCFYVTKIRDFFNLNIGSNLKKYFVLTSPRVQKHLSHTIFHSIKCAVNQPIFFHNSELKICVNTYAQTMSQINYRSTEEANKPAFLRPVHTNHLDMVNSLFLRYTLPS